MMRDKWTAIARANDGIDKVHTKVLANISLNIFLKVLSLL